MFAPSRIRSNPRSLSTGSRKRGHGNAPAPSCPTLRIGVPSRHRSFRPGWHRIARRCVVLVEAFAGCSSQLALVDVVLLDVTGVGLVLLIAMGGFDVVSGVEPDDVQRLQRA